MIVRLRQVGRLADRAGFVPRILGAGRGGFYIPAKLLAASVVMR
jgi:hypothetical protein